MRTLAFFGLIASVACLICTFVLSEQSCYNWSCDCTYQIKYQPIMVFVSLVLSIFFLIYCTLFLYKIKENKEVILNIKHDTQILDAELKDIEQSYNMYQLPTVKNFTKAGVFASLLFFIFCYELAIGGCELIEPCSSEGLCNSDFSFDKEIYLMCYGLSTILFIVLTVVSYLKSYPSKYPAS